MPFISFFRSMPAATTLFALAAILPSPLQAAADSTGSENAPAGSHTVFMGLDLRVDRDHARWPVVNADGDTVEILQDGTTTRLPTRTADIKASFLPRVGRIRLDIAEVHAARVYSPERDPARENMRQQILMDSVRMQAREVAEINARGVALGSGMAAASALRSGDSPAAAEDAASGAMQNLNNVPDAFAAALPGVDTGAVGNFDAYEVVCRISAPSEIDHAYGALVLNVRDPGKSQEIGQAVKFFEVRQLGPKPRRISVVQEGLPLGFSIESYAVHIFSEGREFPTNLSKNSVSVSRDDAHQFLILLYVRDHPTGTRPVALIPELLPEGLASLTTPEQAKGTIEFQVDRSGRVVALHEAGGTGTTIGPAVDAALRDLRFFPALADGTPVEGSGTFALATIVH